MALFSACVWPYHDRQLRVSFCSVHKDGFHGPSCFTVLAPRARAVRGFGVAHRFPVGASGLQLPRLKVARCRLPDARCPRPDDRCPLPGTRCPCPGARCRHRVSRDPSWRHRAGDRVFDRGRPAEGGRHPVPGRQLMPLDPASLDPGSSTMDSPLHSRAEIDAVLATVSEDQRPCWYLVYDHSDMGCPAAPNGQRISALRKSGTVAPPGWILSMTCWTCPASDPACATTSH
jgi:hypothetical protein